MNDHADTRTLRAVALTPDEGGHCLALTENGKVIHAMSPDHAAEHHPEVVEAGECVPVTVYRRREAPRRAAGDGPAQVATDAYRDGWERIFGRGKTPAVGEA